jgi:long-chain fatty acid transport protein
VACSHGRLTVARRWTGRAAFVALCGLLAPSPVAAQSSLQVPIQFDFLNPSARSLALGSAFVGLADDATAALVNPAGLVQLTRKEISIEGRYRHLEQPFLIGGRLSGTPTGQLQDTLSGPQYETIGASNFSPTFVSFVYPYRTFRVAAFYNEVTRVEQDFSSRGIIQNHGFDTRDTAFDANRTMSVHTVGASAAREWRNVSVGAGLLVQRFSLGFDFKRFAHDSLYGAPDPRQQLLHFTQDGDDVAVGAVVGVLVPVSVARVGVSYKRAPRFDFTSFSGGPVGSQQSIASTFKVPDVLAVGASTLWNDVLLLTVEYTRVLHSQLFSEYVDVLASQGESGPRADRFTINDANEFHVGAEWMLPVRGRPGIRGGAWFDPDHSVRYDPTAANDLLDERIVAALSSGRDLWHYTFGGMVAVHPRVDLSAAFDHSDRSTIVSLSAIVRF